MGDGRGTPAPGARTAVWLTDLGMLTVLVASWLDVPLIDLHSAVGLGFTALVGVHLAHRRRWIAAVARRAFRRVRTAWRQRGLARTVTLDLAMAVSGAVMVVSGIRDWADPSRTVWHAASSTVFTGLVLWHVWRRRYGLRRRGVRTVTGRGAEPPPTPDAH